MYALLMTGVIVNYSFQLCFLLLPSGSRKGLPGTNYPYKVCVLELGGGWAWGDKRGRRAS